MTTKAVWLKTYIAEMNADHKRHPENWAVDPKQFESLANLMTIKTQTNPGGVHISDNMKRACKKLGGSPTIKGVRALLGALED